jgi:hypothetical protein
VDWADTRNGNSQAHFDTRANSAHRTEPLSIEARGRGGEQSGIPHVRHAGKQGSLAISRPLGLDPFGEARSERGKFRPGKCKDEAVDIRAELSDRLHPKIFRFLHDRKIKRRNIMYLVPSQEQTFVSRPRPSNVKVRSLPRPYVGRRLREAQPDAELPRASVHLESHSTHEPRVRDVAFFPTRRIPHSPRSQLLPTFIGFLIQSVSLPRRGQTDGITRESPAVA